MHLLIPFAGASTEPARQALAGLQLPHLGRWLARPMQTHRDEGDEDSLTPPHERALGRHLGWQAGDGRWPWAAWLARQDGLALAADAAVGLLTPTHWAVGADQVTQLDPDQLTLSDAESQQLLAAVQPLFASEGWALHWGAATRWYACHASLAGLRTASPDRVIGRSVDRWMPSDPQARLVRRLQSEVQMLLYSHPVNDAREARGQQAVNSFWLSGCGVLPAGTPPALAGVTVATQLRGPALAGDWPAWRAAWQALDAQAMPALLQQPGATLTLCGERHAHSCRASAVPAWRLGQRLAARWRAPTARAVLESL